jgi:hypothetical protein
VHGRSLCALRWDSLYRVLVRCPRGWTFGAGVPSYEFIAPAGWDLPSCSPGDYTTIDVGECGCKGNAYAFCGGTAYTECSCEIGVGWTFIAHE